MKTKFRLTILIIASFLLLSPLNFSQSSNYTLMIDDEIIEMAYPTYEFGGEIMVDVISLFEALNLSVDYYPETNEIIGYRNNIFIKLKAGTNIIDKNGKSFEMSNNAVVKFLTGDNYLDMGTTVLDKTTNTTYDKERLIAPLSYLSETFNIDQEWMDSTTLMLHRNSSSFDSKYFMNNLYNEQPLKGIDGVIYIPEFWTKHDKTPNTFFYSDDFESFNIEIQKIDSSGNDLRQIDEEIKNRELVLYGDDLSLTGTQTKKLSDKTALVSYSTLELNEEAVNRIRYLINIQDQTYLIQGRYNQKAVESSTIKMFDQIVSSFTISNINIDTDEEYFFLTDKYFELETVLDKEIYSNMDINGSLQLTGSFKTDDAVERIRVTVEKGTQSKVFVIPVVDNTFDYTIFTPFKLGKHNISISVPKEKASDNSTYLSVDEGSQAYSFKLRALINAIENDIKDSNNYDEIIMVSVINTSAKESLYLLPSEYINSEDENIYNAAIILDHEPGDYYKSKAIYHYILENYTLDNTDKDYLKASSEVFVSKEGNELEMANLYAAMLRSMDIPARVVRGTTLNSDEYWTESYINGKWQTDNIGWAMKLRIITRNKPYIFFDLSANDMKAFETEYILPF